MSSGGAITVDTVAALTVTIDDVVRVNFNSTTTNLPDESRTLAALEDLQTSSNGPIKLVSEDGTVTIEPGADNTFGVSADGTGNVLLEARGAADDVIINAAVLSGSGHVTIDAADDVLQNSDIRTDGTGGAGTVLVTAGNNDQGMSPSTDGIQMADGTVISSPSGAIRLVADQESDIVLGLLDTGAGTGFVSLLAERSILDEAGDLNDLNVLTATLRIEADAAISNPRDQAGTIGTADPANSPALNSIDTQVTTPGGLCGGRDLCTGSR